MSTIVRDNKDAKIWLLTKGAESSVLRRLKHQAEDSHELVDETLKHIDDFAMVKY